MSTALLEARYAASLASVVRAAYEAQHSGLGAQGANDSGAFAADAAEEAEALDQAERLERAGDKATAERLRTIAAVARAEREAAAGDED